MNAQAHSVIQVNTTRRIQTTQILTREQSQLSTFSIKTALKHMVLGHEEKDNKVSPVVSQCM